MKNRPSYLRLLGMGTRSAIVTPRTRQIETSCSKSARGLSPDSSRLIVFCDTPTASASSTCVSPPASRNALSLKSTGDIPQYTPTVHMTERCISYLVHADIVAPVKARAGQIIVCNPRSAPQTLSVIVKESHGRIVGTQTRLGIPDAFAQLETLAECGVLSVMTQDASEVRA